MSRKIKYIYLSDFDKVYSKCIIIIQKNRKKEEGHKKIEKKSYETLWLTTFLFEFVQNLKQAIYTDLV